MSSRKRHSSYSIMFGSLSSLRTEVQKVLQKFLPCEMGQFGSSPKKSEKSHKDVKETVPVVSSSEVFLRKYGKLLRDKGFVPDFLLIKESISSEFVDEDGDEAHEFYTEKVDGDLRRLTRTHMNLKPKGKERHEIPRLSPDLPVVMLELPSK